MPDTAHDFIGFTRLIIQRGIIAGIVMFSVACATVDNPDPFEGMNRKVMAFNDEADRLILKPLAKGYINITSEPVRRSVSNFYDNFAYPITILNQFLQGKVRLGFRDLGRFVVNTTLGLLGFFDVATKFGLEQHDEDFGQTLGVWGVGSGPYLVLPILGPSSVRDGTGLLVDAVVRNEIRNEIVDLETWQEWTWTILDAIDTRAHVAFRYYETGSPFEYEWVRMLYSTKRQLDIEK